MDQEALLPFDTPSNANNANNQNSAYKVNYNQNTLTFNGYLNYRLYICQSVILFLLVTGLVLLFIFKKDKPWGLVLIAFIFAIFFLCCYTYGKSVKKVEFIKRAYNKQLTIKIAQRCCCYREYTILLENRYLLYQGDLILINTLKDPKEIDLDNSDIKNVPIDLISKYEIFMGLKGAYNEIQLKIDELLGQQKYENKIYDEINKYISLYKKNYLRDIKKTFDIYMKINDYFYTFFYSVSFMDSRTDFIYSNDFERLFIGAVNNEKYFKTLLINLNEINAFEMYEEKKFDNDDTYYLDCLKVMYKNGQQEQIRICQDNKLYLEKFVLLLNGKLKEINEMKKK